MRQQSMIHQIVNKMYDNSKIQCNVCGIRVKSETQLMKHLDYHFKFNKMIFDR